jgi:hypothetical protein
MRDNWEYKGFYRKYDMTGVIELPNDSKLKVCDLIEEMPAFMKDADTIFIDPPCHMGNLRSFYTKSDIHLNNSYNCFNNMLFKRIDEIKPKHLFIEVFASNYNYILEQSKNRFKNVIIYESFYYKNKNNKCWVFHCSNETITINPSICNIDEEMIIKWIGKNHEYNCIGDLCMGTGLVGKYAFDSGRKFVGTELNKKRLAILVHYIKTGKWNK